MVRRPDRLEEGSGRTPDPAEVIALRHDMGLTQTEFGRLVYRSLRSVQDWEGGLRKCPPDTWEYLCLLHRHPQIEKYRKRLHASWKFRLAERT